MKALALLLAVIFFVVGLLYGVGVLNAFTKSGTEHAHHISHLILFWGLAFLSLIWLRFQSASGTR